MKGLDSGIDDRFRVSIVEPGFTAVTYNFGVSVAGIRADKTIASSKAQSGRYGVAIGPWNGTAIVEAGAGGVASTGKSKSAKNPSTASAGGGGIAAVNDGGSAMAGDGSVAFARGPKGLAEVASWGTAKCNGPGSEAIAGLQGDALVQEGTAKAGTFGLVSVRRAGRGKTGPGGVVVLWNHASNIPEKILDPYHEIDVGSDNHADATKGSAAAGEGGLIIAFFDDGTGARVPVVGFVGTAGPYPVRLQSGLHPGVEYCVNGDGELVPVKNTGVKAKGRKTSK